METCYAIKDWEKHFENSESRKIKSLTWVPVKNKHDGKGYRRVVAHPKSIQVLCAWYLIVQVASKMPVRGVLRDDDGPLTTSDLNFKTGLPEHIFEEAFKVLADTKIGWLIRLNPDNIPEAPETSGDVGIEQNGTEGKGTEVLKKERESPFPEANMPSWEEVKGMAEMHCIPQATALGFWEHYHSKNLWRNKHGVMINVLPSLQIWHNKQRSGDHPHANHHKNPGRPNPRLAGQSDDVAAKRASVAAALAAGD